MAPETRGKAVRLIEMFEQRLQEFVSQAGIPRRYIRPLAPGSIICGAIQDIIYVGYLPQLGMPTINFSALSMMRPGVPSMLSFHGFLMDATTSDFSIVELHETWLDLDVAAQSATLESVVVQVVQSELSRIQVPSAMIPFNPVFGPNKYPVQENLVFVLMPFEAELTAIYLDVVKPTVEAKNLVCRRADDFDTNNVIMFDIWKSICEARFIIADLSTRNPNVMYELGIAHTIGKETILIHQDSGDSKFPFDVSHFRIINYKNSVTGGSALRNRLEATINSVLQKLSSTKLAV